jgi:hypothetical protein
MQMLCDDVNQKVPPGTHRAGAGGTARSRFSTKRLIASITATGWSLCAECRQSASLSSSTPVELRAPDAIASTCAGVPYSSSSPWIASTGQVNVRQAVLDVPGAEIRMQPDVVPAPDGLRSTSRWYLPSFCRGRWSRRRPWPGRCWRIEMSSTKTMRRHEDQAGIAPRPAGVEQRDGAAVGMADQHRLVDLQLVEHFGQRSQRLVDACSAVPKGLLRAGRTGRSRSANTPVCGSRSRRRPSPGSRATSPASPGLRAGSTKVGRLIWWAGISGIRG